MKKLTEQEVSRKLLEMNDWKLTDEKWIERKFRFKNYLSGIEFVQQVAKVSEEANHHPFISIDYKLIRIKVTSWRANGLTELDFILAKKVDSRYQQGTHG